MLATIVNMLAIFFGGIVGLLLRKGIPDAAKVTLMQGMGLAIIIIGAKMAVTAENDIVVILSVALGAIIGEALHLDRRLNALGLGLKKRLRVNDSRFVEGFVSASLIFCVGAMAIVGSIEAGLNGAYEVLFVKSALDGICAIVLASSMGIGVVFSGVMVLLYQGAITLLAGVVQGFLTTGVINYLTASGGLLIMGIGISIGGIKEMNTINLLPGIFLAGIAGWLLQMM